jgi:hypothetical protein
MEAGSYLSFTWSQTSFDFPLILNNFGGFFKPNKKVDSLVGTPMVRLDLKEAY